MPSWPLIAAEAAGESFAASSTNYVAVAGGLRQEPTADTEAAWQVRDTYTLSNLQVRCKTHGGGTNTVVRSRVNNANGNQIVTLTSGGATFEDTSNTDSLEGTTPDRVETQIVAGDTGATVITNIQYKLLHSSDDSPVYITSMDSSNVFAASTSQYFPIGGVAAQGVTDEVRSSTKIINGAANCTFDKLYVYLGANSTTGGTNDITFRDDASDTSLTVAPTVGVTGAFEDTSNTAVVATGSLVNNHIGVGTGGGIRLSITSMRCTSNTAKRMLVNFSGSDMILADGNTYHFSIEGSGIISAGNGEANAKTDMIAGVIKNLYMYQRTRVGSTTVVGTLVKNGTDTDLTATIDGTGAQTAVDETNSVTVSAGDDISIKLVAATATNSRFTMASVEFEQAVAVGATRGLRKLRGVGA